MVIDETAVPSIYWEPREPRLNRQGLVADLKARRGDRRGFSFQSGTSFEREGAVMAFSTKQVQALRRHPRPCPYPNPRDQWP